jgi:DegV family protein with EDD domain
MAVRVVTDSTADLPPALASEWGITVVPLNVHFGEETFKDGVDLQADQFFKRLASSPQLPTTSQPSIGEFLDIYRALTANGDEVVSIHISEKLSGTMNSARQARAELGDEGRVEVIDSLFCSMVLGLIVLEAAQEAQKEGSGLQSVVARTNDAIARAKLLAVLDTLEYLAKGGRIGKAQSFLGGLLQVKAMIEVKDGEVYPVERVRTRERSLERLVELVKGHGPMERMTVVHANAAEDAERVAQQVQPLLVRGSVVQSTIGPVIGTYAGPGAIGIGFLTRS